MKESVSAVFVTNELVYFIKRQNYLSVFPGYYATPGGKVDKDESDVYPDFCQKFSPLKKFTPQVLNALVREVREELNFDLETELRNGRVLSIDYIGLAITPEFNPYRFKNYYFKITLNGKIDFAFDAQEVEFGCWATPHELYQRYRTGEVLAVPPAIMLLNALSENIARTDELTLELTYDPQTEVPMIESVCGVRQFLPLSNTFPPANRTNCFLIGDKEATKLLIDPSPKNTEELEKLKNSLKKFRIDRVFITHHHPDHWEYADVVARYFQVPMDMSRYTYDRLVEKKGKDFFQGIEVHFRKEGDVITKSLGQDVVVYEVPGHDEGQLALAPRSMNWFLAGDLIQTVGTVAILAPEGDMKKYFQSLENVIALNPKNVIPSHGIIVGGVDKLIQTLRHRQMREDQIIELLKKGLNNEEMVDVIYEGLEPRLRPYALKTLEAHLAKIADD